MNETYPLEIQIQNLQAKCRLGNKTIHHQISQSRARIPWAKIRETAPDGNRFLEI